MFIIEDYYIIRFICLLQKIIILLGLYVYYGRQVRIIKVLYHFPLQDMSKQEIKVKCDAYKNMIKAEAKYIEAKENYYEVA